MYICIPQAPVASLYYARAHGIVSKGGAGMLRGRAGRPGFHGMLVDDKNAIAVVPC